MINDVDDDDYDDGDDDDDGDGDDCDGDDDDGDGGDDDDNGDDGEDEHDDDVQSIPYTGVKHQKRPNAAPSFKTNCLVFHLTETMGMNRVYTENNNAYGITHGTWIPV